MFQGATSFDKDIRTWVTKGGILSSGVTFVDMFNNATAMTVIYGTSGTNPDPFYGNTPPKSNSLILHVWILRL